MDENCLTAVFEKSPFAFAHHKVIFDENNKPVDYIHKSFWFTA